MTRAPRPASIRRRRSGGRRVGNPIAGKSIGGMWYRRTAKRALIEAKLRENPEWANNRIAKVLGCSHMTVKAVRAELEATCQIGRLDFREGADGKLREDKRHQEPTWTSRLFPEHLGGLLIIAITLASAGYAPAIRPPRLVAASRWGSDRARRNG